MTTYLFTGTVRKSGVVFRVEATDADEARKLAARGDFQEFDDIGASLDDWMIDPETAEEDRINEPARQS